MHIVERHPNNWGLLRLPKQTIYSIKQWFRGQPKTEEEQYLKEKQEPVKRHSLVKLSQMRSKAPLLQKC